MKVTAVSLFFLSSFLASTARAEVSSYKKESLDLLQIVSRCPSEMELLNRFGRPQSASREVSEGREVYIINFVKGGLTPMSPEVRPVGTLKISGTWKKTPPHAFDAIPGYFEYKCKMTLSPELNQQRAEEWQAFDMEDSGE